MPYIPRTFIGLLLILWLSGCGEPTAVSKMQSAWVPDTARDLLGPDCMVHLHRAGNLIEQRPLSDRPSLRVQTASQFDYDSEFRIPISQPISRGQAGVIQAWLRCADAPDRQTDGQVRLYFQQAGRPWTKSANRTCAVGPGWTRVDLPFTCAGDYGPGEAQIGIAVADRVQRIVLRDVKLWLVPDRKPDDVAFAAAAPEYDGGGAAAAWRQQAKEMIQQHRMSDFTIKVIDEQGRPVKGAMVRIELIRHDFGFGTHIDAGWLATYDNAPPTTTETFRTWVTHYINQVTIDLDNPHAAAAVDWLYAYGIAVRAATSLNSDSPDSRHMGLRSAMERVSYLLQRWPRVNQWLVFDNLIGWHSDKAGSLGPDGIAELIRLASERRPGSVRMVHTARVLAELGTMEQSPSNPITTLSELQQSVAAINQHTDALDIVGMQGRFGAVSMPSPEKLMAGLVALRELNRPVAITALDLQGNPPQAQAAFVRDLLTVAYASPNVSSVTLARAWTSIDQPGGISLWNRNTNEITPAGRAWAQLVGEQWHCDESGKTNRQGELSRPAHHGRYQISVTHRNRTDTYSFDLTSTATQLIAQISSP